MPKGYWVVGVTVTNPTKYEDYRALNGVAFKKYGGRFLVRGGAYENPLGKVRERTVVIEFPTIEAAKACYRSPEYQKAVDARGDSAVMDIAIVEGYEGKQP